MDSQFQKNTTISFGIWPIVKMQLRSFTNLSELLLAKNPKFILGQILLKQTFILQLNNNFVLKSHHNLQHFCSNIGWGVSFFFISLPRSDILGTSLTCTRHEDLRQTEHTHSS